jgi:hypothetical protein
MPRTATIVMEIVALATDVHSADHRPGTPKPLSPGCARRTTKAPIGIARYSASSPPR